MILMLGDYMRFIFLIQWDTKGEPPSKSSEGRWNRPEVG